MRVTCSNLTADSEHARGRKQVACTQKRELRPELFACYLYCARLQQLIGAPLHRLCATPARIWYPWQATAENWKGFGLDLMVCFRTFAQLLLHKGTLKLGVSRCLVLQGLLKLKLQTSMCWACLLYSLPLPQTLTCRLLWLTLFPAVTLHRRHSNT